jgi:hypothetical protein
MTRSALPLALIACLAASERTLAAEEPPTVASHGRVISAFARPRLDVGSPSLLLKGLADAAPAQRRSSRDTVRNGAIIGAIAGALGAGAFGGLICRLYQEEGGPSCWPDALRGAAIGAAIGTGAGIAVDAARTRHPGVGVRISVTF